MPYATYRFNKIIAAETIRFIVTVAIVVYKGLKLVVYRMLTSDFPVQVFNEICGIDYFSDFQRELEETVWSSQLFLHESMA